MSIDIRPGYVHVPLAIPIPEHVSVPGITLARARRDPGSRMVYERDGQGQPWRPVTARQYCDRFLRLAIGLRRAGVAAGDAVAILAPSSYTWVAVDLALQTIGAVVVPIYETDSAAQIAHIVADAGVKWLVAADAAQAARCPQVAAVRVFDMSAGALARLQEAGRGHEDEAEHLVDVLDPDTRCTIVYTSGTTGTPRGVPLTHRNLGSMLLQQQPFFPEAIHNPGVRCLMFLPLGHVFARTAAYMPFPGYACTAYAADMRNLSDDFATFHPTAIGAVPRVFEKIYDGAKAKANTALKARIFNWAEGVAVALAPYVRAEKRPPLGLRLRAALARRLVFDKLTAALGGRLTCAVSGGAPLASRIEEFFTGVGVRIYNGYGMTEAGGGVLCNTYAATRVGAVGHPLPTCTIKTAPDGELLIKCAGMFTGYTDGRDQDRLFDADGYYRSGDLGRIDADGYVFITGRKSDILVTAGGKNVQPLAMEEAARRHPLISQMMVVGEGRRYVGALVDLDPEGLRAWAASHGYADLVPGRAATDRRVLAQVTDVLRRVNRAVSRAESIRRFVIVGDGINAENGLLTASLKMKRSQIAHHFAAQIDALYAGTQGHDVTPVG